LRYFIKTLCIILAAFGRFSGATTNKSLLIAQLHSRAAQENIEYLELMTGVGTSNKTYGLDKWNDSLSVLYDQPVKRGLKESAKKASANMNKIDAKSIDLLEAGDLGRNVTVRYLCTASRIKPKKDVFS
jgi:hypothetical protein